MYVCVYVCMYLSTQFNLGLGRHTPLFTSQASSLMEVVHDIVIVGAEIAGLATSLGLHRLGIGSLILESADTLRAQGYALALWTNVVRALDALGVGDFLLRQGNNPHNRLKRLVGLSVPSGHITETCLWSEEPHQVWRVNRKVLLETLKNQLPHGTIRYSSKVVQIETQHHSDSAGRFYKCIHLADGTILKAKVLIGCDGVNSVVAKYLGYRKPSPAGRASIRGYVKYEEDGRHHSIEPVFLQLFGYGIRYGHTPCDDLGGIYWFFTYIYPHSPQEKGIEKDPAKMKQFVLSKLGNVSSEAKDILEKTDLNSMIWSRVQYRHPWELLWGNISKDNIVIAGDALHPITPDIGQGGCSALEDAVVLARVLGEALTLPPQQLGIHNNNNNQQGAEEEHKRIKMGLDKYAKQRRWRSMKLVSVAYAVGFIQQSDGICISFLRDKIMGKFLAALLLWMAQFHSGTLTHS